MSIRQDPMLHKVVVVVTALAAILVCQLAAAQGDRPTGERTNEIHAGSNTVLGNRSELLTVGSQAMLAGRWEDGVRLTLQGLERRGITTRERASALSNLCGGYAALKQPELAIDYCTESIELNDGNWRAWSNRSYAYWLMNDYELAGADLEQAMELNSRARQLFQIRGMLNEQGLVPRIEMEDRQ